MPGHLWDDSRVYPGGGIIDLIPGVALIALQVEDFLAIVVKALAIDFSKLAPPVPW